MNNIPIEQIRTIGAVSRWISGGTPDRSKSHYWQGDIPWISAFTLKRTEIFTSDQFITTQAAKAGSRMAPIDSTLLLVRGSALHKEIRAGLVTAPVAFNQDVKALIPTAEIEPKYLTFAIQGNADKLLRLVTSAGNTAGVLDTKVVQDFEIWMPDKPEQREIVARLNDVDALISSLEKLIAKKHAIKEGMMQELLTGKTRLPGFSKAWTKTRLGDLGKTYGGLTGKSGEDFGSGNAEFITFVDVMANVQIDGTKTSKVRVKDGERQNTVRVGDLLFNGSSETPDELALCSAVASVGPDTYLNSFCFGFRPRSTSTLDPNFLAYLFRGTPGRNLLQALAQGATRYNLSKSQFRELTLLLPEVDEQQRIAQYIRDADVAIDTVKMRLRHMQLVKHGMMQELLTGRTRIQTAEVSA